MSIFASSRSDFRIEYVAFSFTLFTRGNSESDKSLKRFRIALKRKMTKKRQQSIEVSSFHYKIRAIDHATSDLLTRQYTKTPELTACAGEMNLT